MTIARFIYRIVLALLLVLPACIANATPATNSSDTVPSKQYFYSKSRLFGLRVTYDASNPTEPPWRGRFFEKRWWGKSYTGSSNFSIRRLPAQLLVSDTGRYVACVGTWNYGLSEEFEVAIYRNDGVLIKWNYLTNMLPKTELGYFPKWLHAPYWTASIEEHSQELVLTPHSQLRPEIPANSECPPLRLDLATGNILTRPEELVPWFLSRYAFMVVSEEPGIPAGSFTQSACKDGLEPVDFETVPKISPQTVLDRRSSIKLPPYPVLAKVAKIRGLLSIELAISKSGSVICARYISGPPQLAPAVLKSALLWEFLPDRADSAPSLVRGIISVRGHFEIGEPSS